MADAISLFRGGIKRTFFCLVRLVSGCRSQRTTRGGEWRRGPEPRGGAGGGAARNHERGRVAARRGTTRVGEWRRGAEPRAWAGGGAAGIGGKSFLLHCPRSLLR